MGFPVEIVFFYFFVFDQTYNLLYNVITYTVIVSTKFPNQN